MGADGWVLLEGFADEGASPQLVRLQLFGARAINESHAVHAVPEIRVHRGFFPLLFTAAAATHRRRDRVAFLERVFLPVLGPAARAAAAIAGGAVEDVAVTEAVLGDAVLLRRTGLIVLHPERTVAPGGDDRAHPPRFLVLWLERKRLGRGGEGQIYAVGSRAQ